MLNLWHAVLLLLTIVLAKVDLSSAFKDPEEEIKDLDGRDCTILGKRRCYATDHCEWDVYEKICDYGSDPTNEPYEPYTREPTPNPTWHPIPTWPPTEETPEPVATPEPDTREPTPNPTWHPIPTWPPTEETPEPTPNPTWHPIPTWPPTDETPEPIGDPTSEPSYEPWLSSAQQLATKADVANIQKTTMIGFGVVGGIIGLYLLGRGCKAVAERRRTDKEMAKLETPLIQDATKSPDSKQATSLNI